ncbi:MAG: DegT/DnrJ/EryC1/StrS family aminotransferase [Armatimonadota bacterium]
MAHRMYGDREMEFLGEVIKSGQLCSLGGPITDRFEKEFAEMIGTKHAVAMNCAMSVLHSSLMCAGVTAGTEVICDPVVIFGALAALYCDAIPTFVDIDPETHQMDASKLEAAITDRTRAVIVTHLWGYPAEIDKIVEIAHKHNLIVVEDCAHSILASYKGRYTGSWGDIGSFSGQGSKQFSLGDGGVGTVSDENLWKKLDLHSGAPTFLAVAYGVHYNYRMNEMTAAVGLGQLSWIREFIDALKVNARYYDQAVEGCDWLRPQKALPGAESTYHFWAGTFRGEKVGINLSDFSEALKKVESSIGLGYTQMAAYQQPVIKDKIAYAFRCPDNNGFAGYPDGLCPNAEFIVPRILLAYTVQSEETAKIEADKLHQVIQMLEK